MHSPPLQVGTKLTTMLLAFALLFPAFFASPPGGHNALGSDLNSVHVSRTIAVASGVTTPASWNASLSLPSDSEVAGLSLSVTTPSPGYTPLTSPIVSLAGGKQLWAWPGEYGSLQGAAAGSNLRANNSSSTVNLALPPGSVAFGYASLATTNGVVSGNYSFSLKIGSTVAQSRQGKAGFGPLSPIPWTNNPSNIQSFSEGEEPDGTYLIAIGEVNGTLTLISQTPGAVGRTIYVISLAPQIPVSTVTVGALSPGSDLSVAATSGANAFVLTPSGNSWLETVFVLPNEGSNTPQFNSIALFRYPNGFPAVAVADDLRGVFISNGTWVGSTVHWINPLSPLMVLPPSSPIFMAAATTPLDARLAIGQGSVVKVLNLTGSASTTSATMNIAGSDSVTGLTFNTTGTSLAMVSASGKLYLDNPVRTGTPPSIYQENNSLIAVAYYGSSARQILGVLSTKNQVVAIAQPWKKPTVINLTGTSTFSPFHSIAFAGINGTVGDDILLSTSSFLVVAPETISFNSTVVGNWARSIQVAVNQTTPIAEGVGNLVASVPLTLTSRNCSIHLLSPQVTYNATQVVSLGTVGTYNRSADRTSIIVRLVTLSSSPGVVFLTVGLTYSSPPPPGSPSWFWNGLMWLSSSVARYALIIGIVLAALGSSLFVLGQAKYLRGPRLRHWKPKAVAEPHDPTATPQGSQPERGAPTPPDPSAGSGEAEKRG